MVEFLKRHYLYFFLSVFAIALFFIAIEDVQSWGDDYAHYIKEGQNIAEGKPYYKTNYVYNDLNVDYAPPSYPPGFPLLLAPVIKVYGLSIRPMLYLISFLMAVLLFTLYNYFRKYSSDLTAVCLAIVTVYSPAVLNMKGYVLSDIPLLVFTSLYLMIRQKENLSHLRIAALIFTAVFAVLIRSQGIILIAAEGIILLWAIFKSFRNKTFTLNFLLKSDSLRILSGFGILYLITINLIFPSPDNSWNFYSSLFGLYQGRMWDILKENCFYLIELLRSILEYQNNTPFLQSIILIVQYLSLVLSFIGLIFCFKKIDKISMLFFLLMCLMIILLPVRQGFRYLLPIVPVYILLVYYGASTVLQKIPLVNKKLTAVVACLIFLFLGLDNFQRKFSDPSWTPYTKEDSLAFDYMKKHISDQELIVFAKPRALTLYTNLKAVNIAYKESNENNKLQFAKLKIKYMLIRDGLDENFVGRYMRATSCAVDSLKIGPLYTLYTVKN